MKKKLKHRHGKAKTDKGSQIASHRFNVNPLIKQELLQLLKETGKTAVDVPDEMPTEWKDYDEPPDFIAGARKLAQKIGVFCNHLSRYDI